MNIRGSLGTAIPTGHIPRRIEHENGVVFHRFDE